MDDTIVYKARPGQDHCNIINYIIIEKCKYSEESHENAKKKWPHSLIAFVCRRNLLFGDSTLVLCALQEEIAPHGFQSNSLKIENMNKLLSPHRLLPPSMNRLTDADKTLSVAMQKTMNIKSSKTNKKFIAVEGRRLIEDAIHAGIKFESIFFSQKDTIRGIQLPESSLTRCFKVPYSKLKLWSTLTTCPGITGIFAQPKSQMLKSLKPGEDRSEDILPLNLVCDQVRDPGNMGAILRVAAAVGCNQVITTKGCVNIWDPKVVRASMGSVFRVPVIQQPSWDELGTLITSESASVYLADHREFLAKGPRDYTDVSFSVASGPIVLVVGGETHGLSARATDIAKATRIRIPLACGVESLNVGTAVAVLVYEIRRQISHSAV
ncbi:Hypothetical predicted protein [Cloeon dipterum]|uniref:tRNA/rRNA methyltransferase SpoU type domain-containing protein n=1 Tax=Cloeon dipterum TaxID=197152 RepID=A0A8S1C1E2_9INSE|nr:Hypothetical predicted protein [Cloeon dipterum]